MASRNGDGFPHLLGRADSTERYPLFSVGCDYILAAMLERGAESWTSADLSLRCAIATVNG
jgi:hypothetical protein